MAAGGNKWKKTNKPYVDEYFLCGEHQRGDGCNLPDVLAKRYPYISDVDRRVGSAKKESFDIKSVIHVTTPQGAVSILQDGGFKPNKKPLPDNYPAGMDNNFIWFGLSVEKEELTTDSSNSNEDNELLSGMFEPVQIHNSPPFSYESRYGNIMFKYDINDVIQAYSEQFCNNAEPKFLVMGTFAYRIEIMHTVLVCPPSTAGQLPGLDKNTSVIFRRDSSWRWQPDSTGLTYRKDAFSTSYRRWEHATFAFLIPGGRLLQLNMLRMHMTYCPPTDERVFRVHTSTDRRRYTFNEVLNYLNGKMAFTGIDLLNMILAHINRNRRETCNNCTNFLEVNPRKLKSLLQGKPWVKTGESFCVHELEKMAEGSETWMTWFRENIHPIQ